MAQDQPIRVGIMGFSRPGPTQICESASRSGDGDRWRRRYRRAKSCTIWLCPGGRPARCATNCRKLPAVNPKPARLVQIGTCREMLPGRGRRAGMADRFTGAGSRDAGNGGNGSTAARARAAAHTARWTVSTGFVMPASTKPMRGGGPHDLCRVRRPPALVPAAALMLSQRFEITMELADHRSRPYLRIQGAGSAGVDIRRSRPSEKTSFPIPRGGQLAGAGVAGLRRQDPHSALNVPIHEVVCLM